MPNVLRLRRSNAPEPNRNSEAIYADAAGTLKQVAPDGSETELGGGGGGGSQPDPDSLTRTILDFQETAGAGIYTASFDVLAGARILEVVFLPIAGPWDADTQLIQMGDVQKGADSYFDANNGENINDICGSPYNAVSPQTDVNFATLATDGTSAPNGYQKAALSKTPSSTSGMTGVRYLNDDTITMTVTTTGAGGTTGHLQVEVLGFGVPVGTVNAVKT